MSRKRSIIWKLEAGEFRKLVVNSISYSEILDYFRLKNKGSNFKTLRNRLTAENIDCSHIKKNRYTHRPTFDRTTKEKVVACLVQNSHEPRKKIRYGILKFNILPYKCNCCGLTEWQGKAISLQLDHVNGTPNDHRLENLRWLCPNCHSQTETFAGRANKGVRPQKLKSPQIRLKRRKVKERPTKEEILKMIEETSFCAVGRKYGVSDNAVRKWLK